MLHSTDLKVLLSFLLPLPQEPHRSGTCHGQLRLQEGRSFRLSSNILNHNRSAANITDARDPWSTFVSDNKTLECMRTR